jgi:hypothetical protein
MCDNNEKKIILKNLDSNPSNPSNPYTEYPKSSKTAFNKNYIDQFSTNMSNEQLENFKKQGEAYYKNMKINEENGELENLIVLKIFELSEALKSGLEPKYLNEEEIEALISNLGKKWYENFGYEESDLPIFKK